MELITIIAIYSAFRLVFDIIAWCVVAYCAIILRRQSHEARQERNKIKFMDGFGSVCGMSYKLSDEEAIMKTIKSKSIEEVAQYADIVTKSNATDVTFLQQQLPDFTPTTVQKGLADPVNRKNYLNPTSIGNIAYVATHAILPYSATARESYDLIMSNL